MDKKRNRMSLGDFFRYVLLIFAIILLVFLIIITLKVYQNYEKRDQDPIEIMTEAQSVKVEVETETQKITEAVTETNQMTEAEQTAETSQMTEKDQITETSQMTETETVSEKDTETVTEKPTESETTKVSETLKQPETKKAETPETTKNTGTTALNDAIVQNSTVGATLPKTEKTEETEKPASSENQNIVTVNTDCNLRGSNEVSDNVIGSCITGQKVEYLGDEEGWAKINANGKIGYIDAKFVDGASSTSVASSSSSNDQSSTSGSAEPAIEIIPQQPQTEPVVVRKPEPVYKSIASTCNIRSYPDYGENVIGEVYPGQVVKYYGIEEGWAKISVDGVTGYIGTKFLN